MTTTEQQSPVADRYWCDTCLAYFAGPGAIIHKGAKCYAVASDAHRSCPAAVGVVMESGWPDGMEMIRQVREALGMFAGAMPTSPKAAWEEALERARRLAQGQCGGCLEQDNRRPWDRAW